MRKVQVPEQADILVSELLGSFGDNEASPECLDGAMRFLKRTFATQRTDNLSFWTSGRNLDTVILYGLSRSNIFAQVAQ